MKSKAMVFPGGILAGGKTAGIDPGRRDESWDRSWRAGRMLGLILAVGKNAGIDPGRWEEYRNRSWRAGQIPESILMGGKSVV